MYVLCVSLLSVDCLTTCGYSSPHKLIEMIPIITHLLHVCFSQCSVFYLSCLTKVGTRREDSLTGCMHALPSTSVQNNISPLYAQYEQCAHVTVEQTPLRRTFFNQRIPALLSHCMNQAVTSWAKITMECRDQVNWHGQYSEYERHQCLCLTTIFEIKIRWLGETCRIHTDTF
jgi:hypothetical protein